VNAPRRAGRFGDRARGRGGVPAAAGQLRFGGIDLVYVHPWLAKEAAETELARRGWHATAAARAIAESAGAPWRVHVRMGEAADRILALAVELGSLGIVIGSHGPTPAEAMLLGSVAYKVVNLGRVPVLVVR
jgi:nucleotide-binding universal stress UspA family protein